MSTNCCEQCDTCPDYPDCMKPGHNYCHIKSCPCHTPNTTKESWRERFDEEFGIHFKDSAGELQFAIAFIETEITKAREEEREQILKLLTDNFSQEFRDIITDHSTSLEK